MQWIKLIFWLVLCQIPAWIGMGAVRANLNWYHALTLPRFAPPDWLFPIVWGVLYVLLGITAYLITRKGWDGLTRKITFGFVVQLIVNALWTPVFFGLHEIGWGLILITLMIVLTACLIWHMLRRSRAAAGLMSVYLAWICFAWALNCAILILN